MFGKSKNGYVALVTAIIISLVLSALLFSLNMRSLSSRFNILDSELKVMSMHAAEGCLDSTVLKLASGITFTKDQVFVDDGFSCKVHTSSSSGVEIETAIQGATTRIRTTLDPSSFTVMARQEVPKW